MPLGEVLQTLMIVGLLSPLAPRPLPQVVHPYFRMDLHWAYHQGPGHTTDQCTTLRHVVQDLIDQGSEPIIFDDGYDDDGVHEVLSSQQIHVHVVSTSSITPVWIPTPRPVTLSCYNVHTPFILTPRPGTVDAPEIQYVIRGGRVVRQQPPIPSRPINPDTAIDELVREDDKILKQL